MPKYVEQPRSLFPAWLSQLTLQQQAVLMAAVRGQDGDTKTTGFKQIASAMRSSFMKAAHTGRMPLIGEHLASFMSLRIFADAETWERMLKVTIEEEGDGAVLHYYTHLMHAAQVLSFKHPDETFRERWRTCYLMMVEKLHLYPESEEEMDERLSDWDRDKWEPEHGMVEPQESRA